MLSVYQIKPAFQKLLQAPLRFMYKSGVTANQLTISAILLSVGMGFLVLFSSQHPSFLLLIPIGFLFRMALNALDGMMARQFNMQSKLGAMLNELGDVISDLVIFFPFVILAEGNEWAIVLFAVLSVLNEFAGLLAQTLSNVRRYDGPMGKSDRALFISLFCIGLYVWPSLSFHIHWIFGIASLLVLLSTFIRLKKSLS